MRHFGIFGAVFGGWRFWVFSQAASHIVYGSLKSFSQQPTPAAFEQNLEQNRQTHTKTKIKAIAKAKAARTLKEIEMVGQNPTSGAKSF